MTEKQDQLHQPSEPSPGQAGGAVSDGNLPDTAGKKPGKRKARKPIPGDDGRTIANMNVEGMPWYRDPEEIEKQRKASKLRLTLKERFAIVWAAYGAYLPRFLVFLLGYLIIALVLYFYWLK